MILFYSLVSDNVGLVFSYHSDLSVSESSVFPHIKVDEFSFPEQIEGKYSKSFINLTTKEITHEYELVPPKPETFEELQTEQNVDFNYRISLLEMGLA